MNAKQLIYKPTGGVCSNKMTIEAKGNVITHVAIEGGCHGNSQGVSALLIGMPVDDAIKRMEGINCKGRGSSCPDQLAQALKQLQKD